MMHQDPNFVLTAETGDAPKNADHLRRQALRFLQHAGGDAGRMGEDRARDFERPDIAPAKVAAPARAMMIGLVTMPAVFIAVVLGALAMFGKPRTDSQIAAIDTLAQPAATPAIGASFASASSKRAAVISLDEDRRIGAISLDGDRVALHVEGPSGQEILIYDYANGRIVAEAAIEMASVEVIDSLAMLTGAPPPEPFSAPAPSATAALTSGIAASSIAQPDAPSMKPRGGD